jgi:flagellar basal-body rod protein FlgB
MAGPQIGLLQALTDNMRWHQTRQQLLSQNVANADTPGYEGRDLKSFAVGEAEDALRSSATITTVATNPEHISVSGGIGALPGSRLNSFEVTPEGNGVTLEDEMMKVTDNQMQYAAVTSLYTKTLQLLRTALGTPGG